MERAGSGTIGGPDRGTPGASEDGVLARARLSRAFQGLVVVIYGLLVFGASVRVRGAGLACPDWPLCFGQVVPQLDFHVFLEWGHRALAGLVSISFVGLGAVVLSRADTRAATGRLVPLAAGALLMQIVLGGLTVLKALAFWSVTLHLLTGNTFLVLNVLIARRLRASAHGRADVDAVPTLVRTLAIALAFALPVQMALGGIVSSNYAGLACPEWPTCRAGVWFPAFADGIGLQILHRLGAYTVFGIVVALFATARKVPALRTRATLLLVVALLQVGLGVANIWLRLPVEIAIAHSGVADLLVLLTTLTVARALELPRAAAAGSPAAILPNPEPA